MPRKDGSVASVVSADRELYGVPGDSAVNKPVRGASDEQLDVNERDVQSQLIQENLRRIFLLIYRIVGNIDDAQDLTQETFIKALQRQSQLKDLNKAGQWLSRIATNTALDFLRRRKGRAYADIESLPEPALFAPVETPEQHVMRGERKVYLDGGLAVLTERERTALLLRDVEDMPADQVAKHMNCSMATVRSHIANARIKFRRYLESKRS